MMSQVQDRQQWRNLPHFLVSNISYFFFFNSFIFILSIPLNYCLLFDIHTHIHHLLRSLHPFKYLPSLLTHVRTHLPSQYWYPQSQISKQFQQCVFELLAWISWVRTTCQSSARDFGTWSELYSTCLEKESPKATSYMLPSWGAEKTLGKLLYIA